MNEVGVGRHRSQQPQRHQTEAESEDCETLRFEDFLCPSVVFWCHSCYGRCHFACIILPPPRPWIFSLHSRVLLVVVMVVTVSVGIVHAKTLARNFLPSSGLVAHVFGRIAKSKVAFERNTAIGPCCCLSLSSLLWMIPPSRNILEQALTLTGTLVVRRNNKTGHVQLNS